MQHSSRNDEAIEDLWAELAGKLSSRAGVFSQPRMGILYSAIMPRHHAWQSLKWLADIHQVASSAPVDWLKVTQKAERLELGLVIRQTLTASSLLLGTPLPLGWSPASLPAGVRLFPNVPFPAGTPEAAFFHLRVLSRPLDKLRCVANVVLGPNRRTGISCGSPPRLALFIMWCGVYAYWGGGFFGYPRTFSMIARRTSGSSEKSRGKLRR